MNSGVIILRSFFQGGKNDPEAVCTFSGIDLLLNKSLF